MIGLVLVTHGRLAEEFRAAMEHVVGPQKNVATICIGPDDDMEHCRGDIRHAIESVDQGDGVVMLTDMFGSTPCNLAMSMLDRQRLEVLSGMNLPMLVKLAQFRDQKPLAELVVGAQEAGRKYITTAPHTPPPAAPMTVAPLAVAPMPATAACLTVPAATNGHDVVARISDERRS
jgi:PTS system mannose-specific IIA component